MFPQLAQQFDCLRLDCAAEDEPRRLHESAPKEGVSLLVVDHPERAFAFEAACRPWAEQILSIDGALRRHECDVLIDPIPDRQPSHYGDLAAADSVLLLGPQYAPLRPSFARCRPTSMARRARCGSVQQVTVVSGATDAMGLASKFLMALDDSCLPDNVKVVLPAAPQCRGVLEQMASRSRLSVEVRGWIPDPANLFSESDLAVACSGSVCWELCALGVPSVVMAVASNQQLIAGSLDRHGAAVVVGCGDGDGARPDEVVSAINRLAGDATLRRKVSEAAVRLCDGEGADRVARIVSERLTLRSR